MQIEAITNVNNNIYCKITGHCSVRSVWHKKTVVQGEKVKVVLKGDKVINTEWLGNVKKTILGMPDKLFN